MVSTETWAPPLLRDRFRLWTSQLLIVAGIAGVPFALVPGLFLEYDVTPKLIVLLCSTAGLLLCWQTWLPGAVSLVRTADGRRYAVLVLVAETSLLLSTVFSQNPALSLGGTVWRRLGLITQASLLAFSFLCAACVASDRKYLKIILTAITLTCGGASIYAIAQYAGLDPIILQKFYTTDYYGTLVRVPSTFGHPLYLGAFLAAGVPVGLGSSNFVTGAQRFLLRACSTFAIIALFLTGSRSASIALVVGLAVAFLRLRLPTARQVLGGAAVCAVLAIGVVVFLNLDEGASLRRRLMEWRDDPYGGPRLLVWRDAVAMVPAHIVVGSGLETFASEFRHRQSADLATAFPDSYHESPHNLILDTVISQGALGLAVLVGFASLVLTSATTKSVPLRCLNGSASAALVALCFIPLTITGEMTLYLSLSSLAVLQADPTPRHVVSNTKVNLFAGPLALILLTAAACFLCKDVAFARIADAVEGGRLGDAAATYRLA